MPEGDTIYRTAERLRAAMIGAEVRHAGSRLARLRAAGVERLVGQTVADVESRGKHLLVWFVPLDVALHTHLGMHGSWRLYAPGEPWRKAAARARVIIQTEAHVAACVLAPVVELLARSSVCAHPVLARLGPDSLGADVDLAEVRRRLDQRLHVPVGEALLDQHVLAGVGNVYKSEVLFVHGVDPWTPVGLLPPALRDALITEAIDLLRRNAASGGGRTTTAILPGQRGERLYVYGRARRPCPRCGTPIRVARQGRQARLTYWCARCQRAGGA